VEIAMVSFCGRVKGKIYVISSVNYVIYYVITSVNYVIYYVIPSVNYVIPSVARDLLTVAQPLTYRLV
jgi:hypothetical protein